ncbi:MAG: transglutaminase domain-containing protein, partial [Candidatus Hodarchaeota archaeon]
ELANQIETANVPDFVLKAVKKIQGGIKYEIQPGEFGAKWAIESKRGDCTEFSALLVALCRVRGIPARTIAGFSSDDSKWERHAAVEVFFGGQWVPIDPTIFTKDPVFGLRPRTICLFRGNWMAKTFHKEILFRASASNVKIEPRWQITRFSKVRLLNNTTNNNQAVVLVNSTQASAKVKINADIPELVPAGRRKFKITIKNERIEFSMSLDAHIEFSGSKIILYRQEVQIPHNSEITKEIEAILPVLAMPVLLTISLRTKTGRICAQLMKKISIY